MERVMETITSSSNSQALIASRILADRLRRALNISTSRKVADPEPQEPDTRSFAERLQAQREAEDRARLFEKASSRPSQEVPGDDLFAALEAIALQEQSDMLDAMSERAKAHALAMEKETRKSVHAAHAPLRAAEPLPEPEPEPEHLLAPVPVDLRDEADRSEDADFRWEKKTLTGYDKRFMELREAEAKRDALIAQADTSEAGVKALKNALVKVAEAKRRLEKEKEFAESDKGRLIYRVNFWRANEGREDYNASRRKVRVEPNKPNITDDEKARREREKNRLKNKQLRDRKKAELAADEEKAERNREEARLRKQRQRERQRLQQAQQLETLPTFGIM